MATKSMERIQNIQSSQLNEVKEYIQFLHTLTKEEKIEFRGIIRGMQAMKDMQHSNAV